MPEILGTLRSPQLSTPPSSPVQGQIYFDTTTDKLYWYDGSAWIVASGEGGVVAPGNEGEFFRTLSGSAVWNPGVKGSDLEWNVGSTPPASPSNNSIWVYVGSGFYWMFVYDASETTYKWKFIGGSSLSAVVATDQTFATSGWVDPATPGPTIAVPRAGEYDVIAVANLYISGQTAAATMYMGLTPSSGTWDATGLGAQSFASLYTLGGVGVTPVVSDVIRGIAAGGTIKEQYQQGGGGGTPHCRQRVLKVWPRRVS